MRVFPPLLGLLLAASPALARPHAVAHLKDLDGKPVGIATFSTVDRGVLIEFDLSGLPPGPHGIHLHGAGNCDPKTGFTSAGPILQVGPLVRKHGYL
ncbi:MAG TPA: superoxide dismutase family protein, partial [Rhizomicrobium sp.]|nr:superoxide dismutase family protein [Rhizomicrobium sp.]